MKDLFGLVVRVIVLLIGVLLLCEVVCARPSLRHDPNITCEQVVPDYTDHLLYPRDCNELAYCVEKCTGQIWVKEFAKNWLSCHPNEDPLNRLDLNWDGKTNLKDFAILSRCRIVYCTPSGTVYHLYWDCQYLTNANRRPTLWQDVGKKKMCLKCMARQAERWVAEN